MPYTPINLPIFLSAYEGALVGLKNRILNPSLGDTVASIAGAYAKEFDIAWNSSDDASEFDITTVKLESGVSWNKLDSFPVKTEDIIKTIIHNIQLAKIVAMGWGTLIMENVLLGNNVFPSRCIWFSKKKTPLTADGKCGAILNGCIFTQSKNTDPPAPPAILITDMDEGDMIQINIPSANNTLIERGVNGNATVLLNGSPV